MTTNLRWIEPGEVGVDYSSPRAPSPAELVDAGYTFVARYAKPSNPRYVKWLTAAESVALHNAGMGIVAVYESYANRPLEGHPAGFADGITMRAWLYDLGYPFEVAAMAAVDIDTTTGNAAACLNYLHGFAAAVKPFSYGVYGDYDAIELVAAPPWPDMAPSALNWQATARSWSANRVHPLAHLRQGNQSADHLTDANRCLRRFLSWGPTIEQPSPLIPPDPTPPTDYHPEREPDMTITPGLTAQMIKDSRYTVVLLVGAGTPEWLTGERMDALSADGIPLVVSEPHPSFAVLAARAGIGNLDQYPA